MEQNEQNITPTNENIQNSAQEEFKDFDEEPADKNSLEMEKDTSLMTPEEIEARIKDLQEAEMNIEEPSVEEDETQSLNENIESIDSDISIFAQKQDSTSSDSEDGLNQTEEGQKQEVKTEVEAQAQANPQQEQNPEQAQEQELSEWEEVNSDNDVVKKYIIYISKDFVPYIDSLSTDERSAYINDALEKKIELENLDKENTVKKRLITHLVLTVITICIVAPFALLGVNKAILATFANYKYSQDNFEKLFKERFEKNKAYARSVKYNKEIEKKKEHSKSKSAKDEGKEKEK